CERNVSEQSITNGTIVHQDNHCLWAASSVVDQCVFEVLEAPLEILLAFNDEARRILLVQWHFVQSVVRLDVPASRDANRRQWSSLFCPKHKMSLADFDACELRFGKREPQRITIRMPIHLSFEEARPYPTCHPNGVEFVPALPDR